MSGKRGPIDPKILAAAKAKEKVTRAKNQRAARVRSRARWIRQVGQNGVARGGGAAAGLDADTW